MNSKHLKASLEERLTSLLPDQSEAALHDALAPSLRAKEVVVIPKYTSRFINLFGGLKLS
jgi:hypothetical protein